jgi:hypothetical protein
MISAKELRAIQANSGKERFINACDKYYTILMNECKLALEYIQNNNMSHVILNGNSLTRQTDGYTYTTMLFGFWNKETCSFNNSIFREYGIVSPLERVTRDLEIFGYKLEHISEPMRLVLKLSF